MKNFRNIIIGVLGTIIVLFVVNIFFLYGLYGSVKEQYVTMAKECLMQADFIETVYRVKRMDSTNHVSVVLDLDGERRMTESGKLTSEFGAVSDSAFAAIAGKEKLMGIYQSMHATMAYNMRNSLPQEYRRPNLRLLDSIYSTELHRIGLYPSRVFVLPADSVNRKETRGLWEIDYTIFKGYPLIYRAYMSPPLGVMLRQTAGIVITTMLIILMLAVAFVYLIRTVMKMRSLEEMKDDFTNNMTHELKTPISAAYSAIDTLLNCDKHNDASKRERYLRLALDQLSRLGELVEGILSMSMERRKSMVLGKEEIELKQVLNDIASIHSLRAEKPITINVSVVPENLSAETDPTHFANVINNLMDNAIKYSGDSVAIDIHADSAGIVIKDNGNGIPAKSLPLIFNKFYRVPTGNRQDVRGYGIGLYYVKSIRAEMGWDIKAASTLGKGSVFTIKFMNHEK